MDIINNKEYSYYALTISPPVREKSPRYLYNGDKPILIRQLNRCSDHYILYPEFDPKGRLHYHGVVRLTSKTSWGFVKSTIQSMIGFSCLKQIKTHGEHIGWLNYCRKEYDAVKLEPIMFKKLPKGRQRLEQSKVEPRKIRTIIDYLEHAENSQSGSEDYRNGRPSVNDLTIARSSAGTTRVVEAIDELDFGIEDYVPAYQMDAKEYSID